MMKMKKEENQNGFKSNLHEWLAEMKEGGRSTASVTKSKPSGMLNSTPHSTGKTETKDYE